MPDVNNFGPFFSGRDRRCALRANTNGNETTPGASCAILETMCTDPYSRFARGDVSCVTLSDTNTGFGIVGKNVAEKAALIDRATLQFFGRHIQRRMKAPTRSHGNQDIRPKSTGPCQKAGRNPLSFCRGQRPVLPLRRQTKCIWKFECLSVPNGLQNSIFIQSARGEIRRLQSGIFVCDKRPIDNVNPVLRIGSVDACNKQEDCKQSRHWPSGTPSSPTQEFVAGAGARLPFRPCKVRPCNFNPLKNPLMTIPLQPKPFTDSPFSIRPSCAEDGGISARNAEVAVPECRR